jgi:hypothetical protein
MINPTIKATLALNLGERMITKKFSGCARGWSVLELKIKEREISSTNASMAIGMRRTRGSNSDNIQTYGFGMTKESASITA